MSNKSVSAKPSKALSVLAGLMISSVATLIVGKIKGVVVCGSSAIGVGFECKYNLADNYWLLAFEASAFVASVALIHWLSAKDDKHQAPILIVD